MEFKTRNEIIVNEPSKGRVFAMFLNDSPYYGGDDLKFLPLNRFSYIGKCFMEQKIKNGVRVSHDGTFAFGVDYEYNRGRMTMYFPSLTKGPYETISEDIKVNGYTGHIENQNIWKMNFELNPITIYGKIYCNDAFGVSGQFFDSDGSQSHVGIFAGSRYGVEYERESLLFSEVSKKIRDRDFRLSWEQSQMGLAKELIRKIKRENSG